MVVLQLPLKTTVKTVLYSIVFKSAQCFNKNCASSVSPQLMCDSGAVCVCLCSALLPLPAGIVGVPTPAAGSFHVNERLGSKCKNLCTWLEDTRKKCGINSLM